MLIKTVFLLLLAYLAVRVVMNLVRAVLTDGKGRSPLDSAERPISFHREAFSPGRERHSARERDVEDARWVDLDGR